MVPKTVSGTVSMHYIFIDESWRPDAFRVAGIIVPQGRYTDAISSVSLQSSKNRLRALDDFLGSANGLGMICWVDLYENYLTERTSDAYTDIKRVSRRDDLWSKVVVLTIQAAIIRLERGKKDTFSAVDVYHDQKDLTQDHREVLYQHLKNEASSMFKALYERRGAERLRKAHIRHVREVRKAEGKADKFQRGIQLTDRLLKLKTLEPSQSLEVINITNHVHRIFRESGIMA